MPAFTKLNGLYQICSGEVQGFVLTLRPNAISAADGGGEGGWRGVDETGG